MASLWKLEPTTERPQLPAGAGVPAKVGGAPEPVGVLSWPSCETCGQPMGFLFQLPSMTGRLELAPFGAVYVFQCEALGSCRNWDALGGANRAVGVKPSPDRRVLGGPGKGGAAERFLTLLPAIQDARVSASPMSKVSGAASWLQDDGTPEVNGQRAQFIAQIAAEPFGLSFGDDGVGYLFRAQEAFLFLWQSA